MTEVRSSMATRPTTYLTLLYANKWWIVGAALLTGIISGFYSLTMEDRFQAKARLLVLEPTVESKAGGYTNVTNTIYTVDTYSSMLNNQTLLADVVRDLGLDFPPDGMSGRSLLGHLSIVPVKDTKLIELAFTYWNPVKSKRIVNTIAERFVELYDSIKTREIISSQQFVREQLDRAGSDFDSIQDSLLFAREYGKVDQLQLRLQNIMEQIKLFQIDLEASKGDFARTEARIGEFQVILPELPEETIASKRELTTYLRDDGSEEATDTVRRAGKLLHDIDLDALAQQTVNASQNSLIREIDSRIKRLQSVALDLENPPGRRRLTPQEWSDRLAELTNGLQNLELALNEIDEQESMAAAYLSPVHIRLETLVDELGGHVAQQTVEQHIQANPLRASLEREYADARIAREGYAAKIRHLETVLIGLRSELKDVESQLYAGMRTVEAMEEESKISSNLKSMLTEKYDQSRIEVAAKLGTMTLVDPAMVPDKKLGPQRKVNVILGLIFGATVAALFVVGREYVITVIRE